MNNFRKLFSFVLVFVFVFSLGITLAPSAYAVNTIVPVPENARYVPHNYQGGINFNSIGHEHWFSFEASGGHHYAISFTHTSSGMFTFTHLTNTNQHMRVHIELYRLTPNGNLELVRSANRQNRIFSLTTNGILPAGRYYVRVVNAVSVLSSPIGPYWMLTISPNSGSAFNLPNRTLNEIRWNQLETVHFTNGPERIYRVLIGNVVNYNARTTLIQRGLSLYSGGEYLLRMDNMLAGVGRTRQEAQTSLDNFIARFPRNTAFGNPPRLNGNLPIITTNY